MNGFLARLSTSSLPPSAAGENPVWRADGIELAAAGSARLVMRGPWVGVVEARLANVNSLRAALGVEPNSDRRTADAACVMAAVERWGAEAIHQLEGAFTAVVWNRETRSGFAMRDRLGLRPLFRTMDGELAISSSLVALRPLVSGDLDPEHVARFLAGRIGEGRTTFSASIQRVPAATLATVSERGGWDERTYWQHDASATFQGSDADAETGFLDRFDASVDSTLGGELGAFLSGGLDSSSIVRTALHHQPDRVLPTFSIVYDRADANEARHLNAIIAQGGVDPRRVDGESLSLLGGLDNDLSAVGEPSAMPNLFLTRTLFAEARAAGLSAVLDGFAGDNVVGHGERRLTELATALRIPTLARELRAIARTTNRPRRAMLDLLRDYVLAPLAAPLRSRQPVVSFAHPDMPAPALPPPEVWTDRAAHVTDLTSPLLPHAFEVAYAVGVAHGIEPRFPFASVPLVEFCLSLPSHQRMRDGLTRSILRRAMRGRLPDSVRLRPGKARLATSFTDALFVRDADRLRQLVAEDVPAASDVLDVSALTQAVARAFDHPEARADLAVPIWRAVVVARWLALTRTGSRR
ncbi:MAG: asparagine synthase (glutamine-hydrolyzing) [Rubricoccaceae bacterium]